MALSKKNRMTRTDFVKRFRSGKRMRGQFCSIQYGLLGKGSSKIAVVVQSKVVSSAVERNRIRRILYNEIVKIIPIFLSAVFVVVIIHSKVTDKSLVHCKQELILMFRKSGIIK